MVSKRIGWAACIFGAAVFSASADQPGLDRFEHFTIQNLAVPGEPGEPFRVQLDLAGEPVVLDLNPHSIRSERFELVVRGEQGERVIADPPAPSTYRGAVEGLADSSAGASIVGGGLYATIFLDSEPGSPWWAVEPLSEYRAGADPSEHVVYRSDQGPPIHGLCGVVGGEHDPAAAPDGGGGGGLDTPLICELAIDTDYEFFTWRGSSVSTALAEVESGMNGVNIIYERDVNVRHELVRVIIHESPTPMYPGPSGQDLLQQFRSFWINNMGSVRRDLAHLLSGRNWSGSAVGVAYLNGVCSNSTGYGVSQWRGFSYVGRVAIVAHEIGHNFSAGHCSGSSCNIMCAAIGGCSGNVTSFGATSRAVISGYAATRPCLTPAPPPTMPLPFVETFPVTSLDEEKWPTRTNVMVNSFVPVNPVIPPNAAVMHSMSHLASGKIDIDPGLWPRPLFFRYWVQHRNIPSGSAFVVEYRTAQNQWRPLDSTVSNGVDQDYFVWREVRLPQDAYHGEFQFRMIGVAPGITNYWIVDNISVSDRCLADMNPDGKLDFFDFLAFQNFFLAGDPRANLQPDNRLDFFDFLAFQNLFLQGCYD
jgi:hypothetical protein